MKKYIVVLSLILLAGLSANVKGQTQKFEILVGGGVDSPLGPKEFSDGYNLGYTAKAAVGYFFTPQFNAGLNISYNHFGLDKDGFFFEEAPTTEFDISGGNLSALEIAGVGKYYFKPSAQKVNFYVMGGPGLAFSRISDFEISVDGETFDLEGESETDFMLTGGAGLTYQMSPAWGVFVEARYSHIFTSEDNTSYMPIRIGVIF